MQERFLYGIGGNVQKFFKKNLPPLLSRFVELLFQCIGISNLPQKSAKSGVGAEPLFGDASGVWNRRMGMRLLRLSNTVAAFGGHWLLCVLCAFAVNCTARCAGDAERAEIRSATPLAR
jgi:hypothetical protein